jgi:uncharacterized protein DUF4124
MTFAEHSMARFVAPSAVAALLLVAAPAAAQVYKWVDDKGVVNYSNEAPPNRNSTVLDAKASRISVYTPDDALKRGGASEASLSEKIDRLERRLDAERYARQRAADQQTQVMDDRYDQCLRDRRVDCDYGDPYYAPYGPAIVMVRPSHFRSRPFVMRPLPPHKRMSRPVVSGRAAVPRQM